MAGFRVRLHCKYYWRLLALASACAVLLIMCSMCKPVSPILWAPPDFATSSFQAPESSKLSNQVEYYYSTRGRILDDDEDPLSRPAPTSYPPPDSNAQSSGADWHEDEHAKGYPPSKKFDPQSKRLQPPLAHP